MSAPLGGRLLYAQCWEDVACARAALRIRPGDSVLAIAAAGDNVLALLRDAPARLLAVDVNPAQSALVDLKLAAVRRLPSEQVAPFLGVPPTDPSGSPAIAETRLAAYQSLRPALPPAVQRLWDTLPDHIAEGVIHSGRFERYLALFRRWVLRLVPGRATVDAMLRARTLAEQCDLYVRRWNTAAWRALFRLFFSRRLLAAFGRHPALFRHCHVTDVGRHYLGRAQVGLTERLLRANPYATYMLSGRHGRCLPQYLRPTALPAIRRRAVCVEVRTQPLMDTLTTLPERSVDAFYLSDVFELFSEAEYEAALEQIVRVGRPGARLCYWNNLVERRRPARLARHLASDDALAASLFARDRAFLYSRFVVETVT